MPIVQLTVVVPEQAPWVAEEETSVSAPGSESEKIMPAAALGPLLWAVIV